MHRFATAGAFTVTLALSVTACSRCNRETPAGSNVPDAVASIPIPADPDAEAPPSPAGSASPGADAAAGGAATAKAAAVPDVKRIDDTHYEVSRAMRDAIVNDPDRFGAGTRALPDIPTGVRLLRVDAGSTAARMGLRTGDIVESVEGAAIPRSAIDARARARKADPVHVTVTRGGAKVTLVYDVV